MPLQFRIARIGEGFFLVLMYSECSVNQPKFDPIAYESFRPLYPLNAFHTLVDALQNFSSPLTLLDLGCGTGAATESFFRAIPEPFHREISVSAADPDRAMLDAARTKLSHALPHASIEFVHAPAENLPYPDSRFHLVLVGSAFHWFHAEEAVKEITRVTASNARALVFEYQFPKALSRSELNEWIRREFNENWRAPRQTPRGTLKEILKPWRTHPAWREVPVPETEMRLSLTAEEFHGHLLSQSRYLHFEAGLGEREKTRYREALLERIQELYAGEGQLDYDLYYKGFAFQKV